MDIIHNLLGHKLPYSWQLIHEIQLNTSFRFNRNSIITNDIKIHRIIEKVIYQANIENEKELKNSLILNDKNTEKILKKNLLRLKKVFEEVVEEKYDEYFDSKIFYQMICNNSFSCNQVINLINFICEKSKEHCIGHYCPLDCWNKMLQFKMRVCLPGREIFLDNFSQIIFRLIDALKEQRTLHLNSKNIVLMRTFLSGTNGIEMERKEVMKSLESGVLKIDYLVFWLNKAKHKVNYTGTNSYDRVLTIHREAMYELLFELSFLPTAKISKTYKLPEFMVLDKDRFDCIKNIVRKLSILISIWFLIQKMINQNYIERVFLSILKVFDIENSINIIIEIIKMHTINTKVNISNIIKKCYSNEKNGIRYLMTKRIIKYITSKDNDNYHKSLKKLKNSLNSVKTDFLKIAEHYEKIYLPLYHSIITES
tara:strand:- start:5503 stop:6777 length:1275 start_codon:yes stop_codon:yes gene_type:complete